MVTKKHIGFCLLTVLWILTGCGRNHSQPIQKSGIYFDTLIQITLYEDDQQSLLDECFQMAETYENMLSKTIEHSDIWNINHAMGDAVIVSEETGYLLEQAKYFAKLSQGAVDPTVGALSGLWDFSENVKQHSVPNIKEIAKALENTGYENLIVKKQALGYEVIAKQGIQVDLGFIAKGYIADKMKEYLTSNHVEHGIINLGGNVLTIGNKPTGETYTIGIQKPFSETGETISMISVKDKSVVSSGIYERCFEENGVIYHHILDMETGFPVQNELYHVTIISDSSMEGDALSTACLVLGLKDGLALLESIPSCEGIFITNTYEIVKTSGLN